MSTLPLQWSPYALLPVLTAMLATFVVARLSSERRYQSVMLLRGLLLAIAVWSLGNAVETVTTSIPGKLLGLRIAYMGVVAVPVLFSSGSAPIGNSSRARSDGPLHRSPSCQPLHGGSRSRAVLINSCGTT